MVDRASSNPNVQAEKPAFIPRIAASDPNVDADPTPAQGASTDNATAPKPRAVTGWSPSAWRQGRR